MLSFFSLNILCAANNANKQTTKIPEKIMSNTWSISQFSTGPNSLFWTTDVFHTFSNENFDLTLRVVLRQKYILHYYIGNISNHHLVALESDQ